MGLTGIWWEPNKTGTLKENGSVCFIPNAAIKHAGICDCEGSAYISEHDFWRMQSSTGGESESVLPGPKPAPYSASVLTHSPCVSTAQAQIS